MTREETYKELSESVKQLLKIYMEVDGWILLHLSLINNENERFFFLQRKHIDNRLTTTEVKIILETYEARILEMDSTEIIFVLKMKDPAVS